MKKIYVLFRTTLEQKPNLYAFVIFFALLLITIATTYRIHGLVTAEEEKNAFYAANSLRNQIELTLNYGLSATRSIALLIEHGSLPTDFERIAEKTLGAYPVLDAIELGPNGVISHVYPYEQNKKAIGFNILGDSIQQAEAAEAIKTQKLIFAGPLNLVQGGVGVVGRLPVFRLDHGEKRFWGFSLVVINIDRLLALAKSDELQTKGYHFQLSRFVSSQSVVDTFVNKHLSLADPMVLNVHVPNGHWQLLIAPISGWNSLKATLPFAFVGTILSSVIGLFIWYVGKQPEKLSKLVAERTEELRLSEEKLRHIFATMEEGLALNELVYNNNGEIIDYRILEINPAFEHMTKLGRNNFVGKLATDVYKMPSEYISSFWNEHINDHHAIKSDIFNEEIKSWKHVSTSKPIDGKFVTTFFDITDLKNAEQALRESELRYRTIVEGLSIGIAIHVNNSIVFVNDIMVSMMGVDSPAGFIGRSVIDFVHPDDRQMVVDAIQSSFSTSNGSPAKKQKVIEERLIKTDGSIITVEASALHTDYQGSPAMIVMINDITERKNAKIALQKSETKYRSLVDNLNEGIWIIDDKAVTVFVNPKMAIILGLPSEEIIGRSLFEFINKDDFAKTYESLDRRKSGVRETREYSFRRKDGTMVHTSLETYPVIDDTGKYNGAVAAFEDITERIIAENEIKMLNADLEERVARRTAQLTEAVAELEAFSYSVSHDLRAPLRSIDGYSAILHERYNDKFDDEGKRLFTNVRNSIDKMDRLIKGLLTLSRVGRGELRYAEHSMEHIIRSTFEECSPEELRGNIRFTLHSMPPVMVDLTLMHQVWTNLISNAIKYSAKRERPALEIGANKEDGKIVFYIKDNGAGFDPKYSNKLFGIFQRLHVDSEFTGLGIGLSIVKRIVQRHGGTVWAEGAKNEGATFYFSIPTTVHE